ncbi:MAG: AAA family ATPase [Gemmataceae bacterium]|nr:AAA family ATPase [Gemmataceae bacterium]
MVSPTVFGGRYRVVRLLKQGHGVETLLGTDEKEGRPVVIKIASGESLSIGAQMRLEHEAGVLRQIRSPLIAPLLALGRQDDLLYLVMPFVQGLTLEERLRRGALWVRDTLTIGRCLMTALQDVHDQGVLHRDLKPANIIVDEATPLTQATIIDFGLARSPRLDAAIRDHPVGTARYMSPEQAGLLDQDPDERSDLYSAGVVLFECLAGRAPFQGDSVGEVLRQHMTVRPPELRSLGVAVPRALDEVIQRLLRKDPRDRYQSAEAVLADLGQIAAAMEKGSADPPFVVGLRDRRRTLTEPAFVGRDMELSALDAQVERARQGQGGLVLLEAESGGGKTRLLQELGQRSARQGCRVFRGQGLDQTAQRPFQVLVGVAAELIHAGKLEYGLAQAVQTRLGEQREAVCAALPELAETLGSPATELLGPETFGQARSLQALAALLDGLGTAERPALVLLDDCQWADELTLNLLSAWQRRREPDRGQRHVLVVVAFRSEEVAQGHWLRTLSPLTPFGRGSEGTPLHMALPPFGAKDIRRLAESMAGPLPHEAVAVVEHLSEGSPFMAAAVLQGLVESGALAAEAAGWRIEPMAMADVQSSRHAAAFLVRRIELLPADVVELLSAGAVLGKEFELDFASKLARQTPAKAVAAVDEARRRHIVWARRRDTHCAFIHDKLRHTLLEKLKAKDREELHRRAALYLEEKVPGRLFDLAYHFDAAGLPGQALPYALAAAGKARAQHSLEVAEQQYRIAERGVAADDRAGRFGIAEGLGDVFMLRGRYDEAAAQFEAALPLAEDSIAQANIEGKLGELAFKRGDIKTATERVERALRQLGKRVPRWSITFVFKVLWEVLVQFLHCMLPRYFVGRKKLEGFGGERLALRLYSRLAHLYWFHRGTTAALWAHLRELNRAECYPPTPELAQAYSEHAPGMSLLAWFRRGIAYAEKSLAMRKESGDLWGQGQSLHFYGIVLYAASRFRDSIARCREAVRLLERTGDFWEVNIARYQIAASLYHVGDLAQALAEAQRMHQSGLDLGDAQASGISLDVWARAALGRVPAEIVEAELARSTGDVQRNAQVLLAEGVRLYYSGRARDAAEVLSQAQRQVAKAGIKNAWVAPVLPWLATCLRKQVEETPALTPGRRQWLIRRALSVARQSMRLTRKFQNNYPHALREYALLLAMNGQPRPARKFFDQSLEVAESQGAVYEHAQTLRARSHVGRELAWPGAKEDLDEAERTLRRLEAPVAGDERLAPPGGDKPVTLSLADRFNTVLDAGRRIASALSRQAIFAAVREAALNLLRGERCLVLKVEGQTGSEDVTLVSGEIAAEFSRVVVRKALDAAHAVTIVEGMPDHSSESVLLSGVRSALCAPIHVRGKAAGCFYVTHRQVANLFGEDEERLADFIATLAGAALENAEGFAELRRLNETLGLQIAEKSRADKRIQEQAALLDKARDAISVLDMDDQILYWNQSAERLYGWTAAEAVGQKADVLLYRGASPERIKARTLALEKGEWTGELAQVTREGMEVVVESRWTLVRDAAGAPKAKLVVNTDVTEKKKLEAQFLRAQRMESIGTLAGGIAHDINNVLLPIMMSVDLLKRDLPAAQRLAILGDLEASAQRGTEMVRQILSFARGVQGDKVLVQLKHVLGEMTKLVQRTFPKSIQYRANLPRDLGVIRGDPTQLYQMLMNLCVNARDAMPEGGTLSIAGENVTIEPQDAPRLHPDARPGPHVRLRIADTGAGIPAAVLDKIFDPFFTTKEFGKGTGLGLSTVLGIVKGHGGFIHVDSTPGVGTEFLLYFPAAEPAANSSSEPSLHLAPEGKGETILVVDDEVSVCQVMQRNLEAHGYHVLVAASGTEALDLVAQYRGKVQLVLTDMMMPDMDGTATIKALREIDPNLRVIAASGMAGVRESAESSGAQFQAFLIKPFRVDSLLRTVDAVLHN